MKQLDEISKFGAIDADNDDILLDSFEDHQAFETLMSLDRFLIVGRKGSGKTAIYKKLLTTKEHDFFCWGHTFADYPWHHHSLQARVGIPDYDKFTHSWKYLILLTASKVILNYDNSLPFDETSMEEMTRIERFVIDSYGTRDPDVTQIFSPTKELHLAPHFELDWKLFKAGIKPERVPMTELPIIVQELNSNLMRAVLSCLSPKNRYFIAFDQLDLGFDPSDPDYKNRLIGLLLAARDLTVAARERGKKFAVAVFLRDDIYDYLQFEDKNKITENFSSLIEWDTPRTRNTLKDLMEKRFRALLSAGGEEVKWEDVFDEDLEMPGHQKKYQHILDRTFLRPRDVIRFCNQILHQYKARKMPSAKLSTKFENVDVHNARVDYSNYFRNELDDEIHKHVPNYRDYLEVLRSIGTWHFERADFEKEFSARDPNDETGASGALQHLFTFSIVGFYRPGGRGYGGSEYVFRYWSFHNLGDVTAFKKRANQRRAFRHSF
jgi:hypothetical protein